MIHLVQVIYLSTVLNYSIDTAAQSVEGPTFEEKYEEPLTPELKFPHEWMFIEQYESFDGKKQDFDNYKANMQELACFNDIVSFWQCWNNVDLKDLKKY